MVHLHKRNHYMYDSFCLYFLCLCFKGKKVILWQFYIWQFLFKKKKWFGFKEIWSVNLTQEKVGHFVTHEFHETFFEIINLDFLM